MPRIRNFCHFSGIRFTLGAFRPLFRQLQIGRQWRSFVNNAEASRDTRVKSIAYELSNWDNSKQAAYSTDKPSHEIHRRISFSAPHRLAPCPIPHLVSLSTSLRSAHVQQNCYYSDSWARNPLARGGGSDVCKTQKARTEIGRRLAYVCQRGNLGQEAALQRLCLRPRSTWRCKIQPHEIETRVAKATQAGRSPEGLLPFYLLPSFGLQKAKDS